MFFGRVFSAALLTLAACLALTRTGQGQAEASVTVIHQFSPPDAHVNVIQAADGSFYGVATGGGSYGYGAIYRYTLDSTATTLYSFRGQGDGDSPQASLLQGNDGNLYGTTYQGGSGGNGGVFKLTTDGAFTVLHLFNGTDGANPLGALIQDGDGNLYGTTVGGGVKGVGVVFRIDAAGGYTVLHNFGVAGGEGGKPKGGLIQGSDGKYYGTASSGGAKGYGTIFSLTADGTLTTLYSFANSSDGSSPWGPLCEGFDGNFYGTTNQGGSSTSSGTVFRITPTGALTTLHAFVNSGGGDGAYPQAGVSRGSDGNFYGTTNRGGNANDGAAFAITPGGAVTILHSFALGESPVSGLFQGADGYLYGVEGNGILYRLTPSGALTTLYRFSGGDTTSPVDGLLAATDGNLYGATTNSFYSLAPDGAERILRTDGGNYYAQPGIIQGKDGNLYENVAYSAEYFSQGGNIFQITPTGESNLLYRSYPSDFNYESLFGGLVEVGSGVFYGTTQVSANGLSNNIFQITAQGAYNVFATFPGRTFLSGSLAVGNDSNLYGATRSTIYRVTADGAITTLHTFGANVDPQGRLLQSGDGYFYGLTYSGGGYDTGTAYRMSPAGDFTYLYNFNDGSHPVGSLVVGPDGNFYGATSQGGANGLGTLFQLTPDGLVTTIHAFTAAEGSSPSGGLAVAGDGTFFGTLSQGGDYNLGFAYRFSLAPRFNSISNVTATRGVAFSFRATATNAPTSYGASNLPAGLSINSATGVVSGTPTSLGQYNVLLSATNVYGSATGTLTLNVVERPPVISGDLSPSAQVGIAFTYQIVASNNPTSYGATGLPPGLDVDAATGQITGTPTRAGTYSTVIKAANSGGTGTATLNLVVKPQPPTITSISSAAGQTGATFSYQITATNAPTSYGASGLPAGLSVNQSTGLISGVPTTPGSSTVTVTATNSGGTGTGTLTLSISRGAPVISSALSASVSTGQAFSYQITATNSPATYGASPLPAGLNVNAGTGLISGTLTTAGTYRIAIEATNDAGTGTATLTLTGRLGAPAVTSAPSASATTGQAFSYQITASNSPASYGASGLPAGLSVNQSTGKISGTPSTAGNYTVTVAAFNSAGSGSATLSLAVKVGPPVVTSALAANGTTGQGFAYQIAATNSPTKYGASGLPAGLGINQSSGQISGTPTTAGTYTVTVAAFNAVGSGTAKVTFTIKAGAPIVTSAPTASGTTGKAFSYQIEATNDPTRFGASGLPAGLSVNQSTGAVSGTPTTAGTYTVTIAAFNAVGSGTAKLTLTIKVGAPVITSALSSTAGVNASFHYQITASGSPTSFGASGLPAGLSVNRSSGLISGTPTVAGTYSVTIAAFNNIGSGSAKLSLTVH